MRRIKKDPEGGWIARDKAGRTVPDPDWRWRTRSAARDAAYQEEWLAGESIHARQKRSPNLERKQP